MLISSEQIKRRLAVRGVRAGDVEFDLDGKRVEIYGRADKHKPGRYVANEAPSLGVEGLVQSAVLFFHGQEQVDGGDVLYDDGRKIA
jgi:hypothetical protein